MRYVQKIQNYGTNKMSLLNQLKQNKFFWFGLFLKTIAIVILAPEIQNKWFLNFISFTIENFSLNPWNDFVESGADPMSYPYGPTMLIMHLPLSFCGYLIDNLNFASNAKNYFLSLGLKSSILIADLCILFLLVQLIKEKIPQIIIFYWLSPIVLYISYWHGQLDIFPTLLLLLSLYFLREKSFFISAITLGLSVACKISVLVAAPFICLYLLLNNRYHKIVWKFILLFVGTIIAIQGPFFLSEGAREMIVGNPALGNLFKLSVPLLQNFNLYLVPTIYTLLILITFKIGRMNFNLLYSFLGSAFFIILIFTPAEIGWYLWVVPFLVAFQINSNSIFFKYGIFLFSIIFVFNKILIDEGSHVHFFTMDIYYLNKDLSEIFLANIERISYQFLHNGSLIILSLVGLILSFFMVRKNIFEDLFFKLINKPILIAISGDSASGKDTLGRALGGVFGENSVASLNGDDYHLYERDSKMWKKLTHLNPKANNLKQFENDSISLKKGIGVNCREYNHETGTFLQKVNIKKKDFILVIGLHALYQKKLRECTDLSIYLDVENNLRKYFKINRDIKKRNYKYLNIVQEIKRRKKDSKLYIEKQKKYADLIFQIDPINKNDLKKHRKSASIDTKIKLIFKKRINKLLFLESLSKIVKKFDYKETKDNLTVEINAFDISINNLELELKKIAGNLDEILALSPEYKTKETGFMQFTILFYIFDHIKEERKNAKTIF